MGSMTWEGVGYFVRIIGNMDANLYCKILNDELLETIKYYKLKQAEVILAQDNDPKHKSIIAQQTIADLGINVFDWLSQSPDLNPIEHLWNHYHRKLKEESLFWSSPDELWDNLEILFQDPNKKLCRNLIAPMPKRIQAVIQAKGGHTKY